MQEVDALTNKPTKTVHVKRTKVVGPHRHGKDKHPFSRTRTLMANTANTKISGIRPSNHKQRTLYNAERTLTAIGAIEDA